MKKEDIELIVAMVCFVIFFSFVGWVFFHDLAKPVPILTQEQALQSHDRYIRIEAKIDKIQQELDSLFGRR